jgi:chromosome segregation ATPase
MENELSALVSRLVTVLSNIESVEKRIKKLEELAVRAQTEGRETSGYDLVREEYKAQISKIVERTGGEIKSLKKYEIDLNTQIESLEKEKKIKMIMCEVERELNEDPTKVSELTEEIHKIEDRMKILDEALRNIFLIKEKLRPYLPKPPTECAHRRKHVVAQMGETVLYACLDCGERWRE